MWQRDDWPIPRTKRCHAEKPINVLHITAAMAYDSRVNGIDQMKMQHATDVVAEIARMFSTYGHEAYGEQCTQLQHAQQCGTLALEGGLGPEFALAAFLHDIGHFIARDRALREVDAYGYAKHSDLGADFLARSGFSDRIVQMIREHVQAKRYLCAVSEGYAQKLSHASRVTLAQQGGPMSAAEAEAYGRKSNLADIVQLRRLDDTGKLPERECPGLEFWLSLAREQLDGMLMRDRTKAVTGIASREPPSEATQPLR